MSLVEYQRKRHFQKTPEPAGKEAPKGGRSFVIQKHAASHLHYDFRLELEGVLKSWAVPKGPSLDPAVKRLAMHVEDHPVAYGTFEGIIPEGEYGGGTVMVWDRGEWEPVGDPHKSYRAGRLKFKLHGEKLQGGWMLVRAGGGQSTSEKERWLLFKERDEFAKTGKKADIVDAAPLSVQSGLDLDEIAAERAAVWTSNPKANGHAKNAGAVRKATALRTRKSSTALQSLPAPSRSQKRKRTPAANDDYDVRGETFRGVRFTSPEKVLYPEDGITKLDLAKYYSAIADWILPHITDRPLVLVRRPEGRDKVCFFQKHPAAGTPDSLRQIPVRDKNKTENYVIADDHAGLIALAQISALEIHAWGSRADKLEYPDRLIFDLDPDSEVPWKRVVEGALEVRQFLLDIGLESFVKTTGGKGLHLLVPIDRRRDWTTVKPFCKRVADLIAAAAPTRYTANMSKSARRGKIYIDYLRNGRGATAIVPYSTRARLGATVSVPLTWKELTADMHSDHFTIRNLPERLSSLKRDPWEGFDDVRQGLGRPIEQLRKLPET